MNKQGKKRQEYLRKYFMKWSQSKKGRYSTYQRNTKNQKGNRIKFNLTFEEFITFWQKPCYYCRDKIKTIGLDRIDSKKDYQIGNVVPCCHICNRLKGDFSATEFIRRAKKIIEKLNNRKM